MSKLNTQYYPSNVPSIYGDNGEVSPAARGYASALAEQQQRQAVPYVNTAGMGQQAKADAIARAIMMKQQMAKGSTNPALKGYNPALESMEEYQQLNQRTPSLMEQVYQLFADAQDAAARRYFYNPNTQIPSNKDALVENTVSPDELFFHYRDAERWKNSNG